MQNHPIKIPLDIQLEAICLPVHWQTWEFLFPYLDELQRWDPRKESKEIFRQIVVDNISFDGKDLISYLQNHPDTCRQLLNNSYDKHYSPATFIVETKNNQYHVGWSSVGRTQVRIFSTLAEATYDYVLFSWGLPRLTNEQAVWSEVDNA